MSELGRVGNTRTGWIVRDGTADLTRTRKSPKRVTIGARPECVVVDVGRTALIVVDMQNDFCAVGGWLDHIGVDVLPLGAVVSSIAEVAARLRALDVPIIFLNWGNRPDRANVPASILHVYDPDGSGIGIGDPLPNGAAVLEHGSWSTALVDGLVAESGDLFIDKYRMTGFVDTELDSVLRNLDVSTLLFAGVNLDQCVYATLTDAAALGYDCLVLEDCCATTSPSECVSSTLYNVAQCYGFVSSAAAVLEGIETYASPPEPVELHDATQPVAHRISPGDTVKLAVIRHPDEVYGASVFLEIWDPGGSQPPNSHPASTETFYILEGTGLAFSDDQVVEIRAHELVVLPPATTHRIENTGPGRLYAITTMAPDAGFTKLVEKGIAEPLDEQDLVVLRRGWSSVH